MELDDAKRARLRELLLAPRGRMVHPPAWAPEVLDLLLDQTVTTLLYMAAAPPVPHATRLAFRATADRTRDASLRKLAKAATEMLDVVERELSASVIFTVAEAGIGREQLQAMVPLLRRIVATDRHGWALPRRGAVAPEPPKPDGIDRPTDPRTVPVAKILLDILIRTAGYDPRRVAGDQDTTGRFVPLLRNVLELLGIPGHARSAAETANLAWVATHPE
jgi:hypothetical protein